MLTYWNDFTDNNLRQALKLVALAGLLTALLLLGRSTQAAESTEDPVVVVHVPQQQIDTDGDGRLDDVSADLFLYADGSAGGTVYYKNYKFLIKFDGRNAVYPDENVLTFTGLDYERSGSQVREVGPATTRVHYSNSYQNAAVEQLDFEITDGNNKKYTFTVIGSVIVQP